MLIPHGAGRWSFTGRVDPALPRRLEGVLKHSTGQPRPLCTSPIIITSSLNPLTRTRPASYATAMLLFKKKFLPAIRSGQKTQTIRLWKYRRMRAGQRSYIPGAGYIRVTAVDQVQLDELTRQDARLDGFETADQLRAEIAQLYSKQSAAGHRAYRITFHLLPPEEQKKC